MYRFERLVDEHRAELCRYAAWSRDSQRAPRAAAARAAVGRALVRLGERLAAPASAPAAR